MQVISKTLSENLSLFAIVSFCFLLVAGSKFVFPLFLVSFGFVFGEDISGVAFLIGLYLIIAYGFKSSIPKKKDAYFHLLGIMCLSYRAIYAIIVSDTSYRDTLYFYISNIIFVILAILAIHSKFERALFYKKYLQQKNERL